MHIQSISAESLQIPMKIRFAQANNETSVSDSVIVTVQTTEGLKGLGECCPRLYVTGESVPSVMKDIAWLEAYLAGKEISDLDALKELLDHEIQQHIGTSTLCGLELALLDALGKSEGKHVLALFGEKEAIKMKYSGIIPLQAIEKLPKLLATWRYVGFADIKIKVSNDLQDGLARIKVIKELFSEDIPIRLDANAGWTLEEAFSQIPTYLEQGITVFEQIFPRGQQAEMQQVTAKFGDRAEIMADEELVSFAAAQSLAETQACNRFNIKLSKVGGILEALKIHRLAARHGITVQLGAHFGETSLLTAAGIIFATLAKDLKALEGGFGTHLLERDITSQPLMFNQQAEIALSSVENLPPGLGLFI
jgi:L-alanine-DL-glutamate epimerase-like enolase superfamily enzyme